jgi:hypothetical protein
VNALRLVAVAQTELALDYLYEERVTEKPELVVDRLGRSKPVCASD